MKNPTKFACECNKEHHKGFVNGDLVNFASHINHSSRPALRIWDKNTARYSQDGWYVSKSIEIPVGAFGIFLDYEAPPPEIRGCTVMVDGIIGNVLRDHVHHATCEKANIRNSLNKNR